MNTDNLEPIHLSEWQEWQEAQNAIAFISTLDAKYYNEINSSENVQEFLKSGSKRSYSNLHSDYSVKITLNQYYKQNISNPDALVRALSKCKCCVKHQEFRPKHLNNWSTPSFSNNFEKNDYCCKCNCRHASRIVCRSCSSTINEEPLMQFP